MLPALAPLAPALLLTGYFLAALAAFAFRCLQRGLPADPEVANRSASPLLGRWIRHYLMWTLSPVEGALVRLRVSPNGVTLGALALACGSGFALGRGSFAVGGWLYLAAGILDIFDGRVARRTNRVTRGGAYFDSVIDRYAELAVFAGLAWYYRGSSVLALVLVAGAGSVMVSYARARGEALGVDVRIGVMQRPERLVYLGVLTAMSPIVEALHPSPGRPLYLPTIAALALLALSGNVTAVRRIRHTLRALDGKPPVPSLIGRVRELMGRARAGRPAAPGPLAERPLA